MEIQPLQTITTHEHNGYDSPRIDPKNLLGFPIFTAVPTHAAPEGTIILRWDGSTTYELYARINKSWKKIALS